MLIFIVMNTIAGDSFIEEIYTTRAQAEKHIELAATVNSDEPAYALTIEEHELNNTVPSVYFLASNQSDQSQNKVIAAKMPKNFHSESAHLSLAYGVTQAEADSNLKKLLQERL